MSETLSSLLEKRSSIEMMLMDNGGELTPEIESELGLTTENLAQKIDGYHAVLSKMEYGMAEIDAEIRRLQALRRAKSSAQKNLRSYLLAKMREFGLDSVEGTTCKVFRKATAPALRLDDEDVLLCGYESELESVTRDWPSWISTGGVVIVKDELRRVLREMQSGESQQEALAVDVSCVPAAGCSLVQGETVQFR